jgi:hypothetical protein
VGGALITDWRDGTLTQFGYEICYSGSQTSALQISERRLGDDCCSRRGRGSNASYEASSHKFFAPIDDKTILTALCLIRLFLERREPRIGLVVE